MLEYGAKKRLGKNKAICWYTALKNVWEEQGDMLVYGANNVWERETRRE